MKKELVSSPFFSVVIATYNRSLLLKRALNSLLAQTEKDWEAIIIDDESTDDTYEQILPYIESNKNIRYIRQTHKGAPISKNNGIYSAKGQFITFLDSDDEFSPQHLQSRRKILAENPEIKFLYGGSLIVGNQFVPDRNNLLKQIDLSECIIGGTFFIERNLAVLLKGFKDLPIGEDAELFERIINENVAGMEVNESTYIYHREINNSITHKFALN